MTDELDGVCNNHRYPTQVESGDRFMLGHDGTYCGDELLLLLLGSNIVLPELLGDPVQLQLLLLSQRPGQSEFTQFAAPVEQFQVGLVPFQVELQCSCLSIRADQQVLVERAGEKLLLCHRNVGGGGLQGRGLPLDIGECDWGAVDQWDIEDAVDGVDGLNGEQIIVESLQIVKDFGTEKFPLRGVGDDQIVVRLVSPLNGTVVAQALIILQYQGVGRGIKIEALCIVTGEPNDDG